jgi:ABC-type dipeptide/oligopeptide/nickel transport system permease subunit
MTRKLAMVLVLLALFGPFGSSGDGYAVDWDALDGSPGTLDSVAAGRWLGTDELGRDFWVRLCLGLRGSIAVGVLALLVAAVLGTGLGVAMGAWRGVSGAFVNRAADILAALPVTLLALVVVSSTGRGLWPVAVTLGALGAVPVARAVRVALLAARNAPYVAVSRIHGAGFWEIARWTYAPALGTACGTACGLLLPQLLVAEGLLGFLGLSIPDPGMTLGSLLAEGSGRLTQAPWAVAAPATAVFLLLLATRSRP